MRDKIKLNSLAVELRRDWDLNPYSPIDLFSIVLSKLPDLKRNYPKICLFALILTCLKADKDLL